MLTGNWAAKTFKVLKQWACPAVLLASLTAPVGAAAQGVPSTISPLQIDPDRNGVNLATGKITPNALTLSVPGSSRLKFDRVQNAAPYSKGVYTNDWDNSSEAYSQQSVHTAEGFSESFSCAKFGGLTIGGECLSVTASGSSMIYNGTEYRRAGTGEKYDYDVLYEHTAAGTNGNPDQKGYSVYYASKITYPDGEVISYQYETVQKVLSQWVTVLLKRPTQVRTNLGYFITITYASSDTNSADWYRPSEAAIFSDAAPTTPIQKFTYPDDHTTVDISGRTYAGFGPGTLGGDIETVAIAQTLPDEGSPAISTTGTQNGQLIGSVTKDGVSWNYSYLNPTLRGTLYEYDKVTVTGPNGYLKTYNIDVAGTVKGAGLQNVVESVKDELNRTTTYDHDNIFRLLKVTYPEGNYVSVTYDGAGNITTKTTVAKPGSGLANLVEQAFVDLAPFVQPTGYIKCRNTTLCWRTTWYKDALNRQTDFTYNSRGQLTEQTDPADQNGVRRKTINEYQEVDTGKTHDELVGGVVTPVAEFISRKTVTRTCGVGTTCGTSDDTRTEYEYWGITYLPSLVRQIDPGTGATREIHYTYDNAGRVLSIDGPLTGTGDTQYFRYDTLGRKTWELGAKGPNNLHIAKRTTYRDSDDKVAAIEMGTLTSSTDTNLQVFERADTTYDSKRNPIRELRKSGATSYAVTDRSFLDRGLPECTATRMNLAALPAATATGACTAGTIGSQGRDRISKNVYDAAGQLVQLREGVGGANEAAEATISYTNNGKRNYVIDANGNRAQLTYDGHDRQTKWAFPSNNMGTRPGTYDFSTQANALSTAGAVSTTDYEAYTYDNAGNRLSLRKRDGSTLTYTYDNLNRMIVKVVPSRAGLTAAQTRDIYYDYDTKGLMTKARFDSLTGADGITSGYNGFGELTSSTIAMAGFSKTLGYAYDKAGKRTELTHADMQKFTYARDILGRVANLYEGTSQVSTAQLIQNSFDNRGLIDIMQRATAGSAFLADFTFDPVGRLSSFANDAAGTANDLTIGQSFNPASQIASQTRSNDAYSWTGSQVLTRNYATNGLNQYTVAGPASFTYDANGNLTSDGSSTFVYDVENRLVSATGGSTSTLIYDPMGRLWQVTGATTDTRFLYDGDELVAEYDSAGTMARRYVHSDNVDDPVVQYDGAAVGASYRTFLMPDERGSIAGLFYNDGTNRAKNSYDEYGIPAGGGSVNTNVGRFQYTGQIWLDEIGMYYYKSRIYSPKLGRFLQVDPIGYEDQYNLYAYVGDDPVNATDPSGEDKCTGSNIDCGSEGGLSKGSSGTIGGGPNIVMTARGDLARNTQSQTGRHDTEFFAGACREGEKGCSENAVFEAWRHNSAPGAPYAKEGTHDVPLTGGNPISQTVDPSSKTIINQTLPPHRYHDGSVRIIVVTKNGIVGARVIGHGDNGKHPIENRLFGPILFRGLAVLVYYSLHPYRDTMAPDVHH